MKKLLMVVFLVLLFASIANATEYFVDPTATGENNGQNWTDAWTSCQTAFNTAVAGDSVYLRGTENNTSGIDINTQTGGPTTGFIKFIGVNASGTNDGTRFVLNGTGASAGVDGIRLATSDYIHLENIQVTSFPGDGLDNPGTNSADYIVINNCSFDHNGGYGVNGNSIKPAIFRSTFNNNTSHGYLTDSGGIPLLVFASSFHDNGGTGYFASSSGSYGTMIACQFYGNATDGISYGLSGVLYNCVIDGNTGKGIFSNSSAQGVFVLGSRITNHTSASSMGIDANTRPMFLGWNYLENNYGDNVQRSNYVSLIGMGGTNTNIEDQSNTNQGYTSLTDGSEDYNLNSSSTLRRSPVTIPR